MPAFKRKSDEPTALHTRASQEKKEMKGNPILLSFHHSLIQIETDDFL